MFTRLTLVCWLVLAGCQQKYINSHHSNDSMDVEQTAAHPAGEESQMGNEVEEVEITDPELKKLQQALAASDINAQDEYGISTLHVAIVRGELATAGILLEQQGIEVNISTTKKVTTRDYGKLVAHSTPLHAAALTCNDEMAKKLAAHPDIVADMRNAEDETAYDLAIRRSCSTPDNYR
ncbi:MAG: hypothetical protein OYH77_07915 [Pseudomonadota bacterium]|nr:hypothetical protein [Pseudomonadota bacterium]